MTRRAKLLVAGVAIAGLLMVYAALGESGTWTVALIAIMYFCLWGRDITSKTHRLAIDDLTKRLADLESRANDPMSWGKSPGGPPH